MVSGASSRPSDRIAGVGAGRDGRIVGSCRDRRISRVAVYDARACGIDHRAVTYLLNVLTYLSIAIALARILTHLQLA